MATRSVIGVMHGDIYKVVYCHWDGYPGPAGVGYLLKEHYDSAKANNLIALGDISALGREIGEKHDFDSIYTGMTKFYGRDRGDTDVEYKTFQNFESLLVYVDAVGAEYGYIMKDDVWYMFDSENTNLVLL